MLPLRRAALTLALLAPGSASAHVTASQHVEPGWTLEPWLLASLWISLGLFAAGALRRWRRSAGGRPVLRRQAVLFAAGWLSLAMAAVSPLHAAGEQSFTLHMVEHELLMLVAAPLLVMSRPLGAMVWSFPIGVRRTLGGVGRDALVRAVWRALTAPIPATLLQAAALWLWHAPALFDLALSSEPWHIVQHLSFFVSALLFWQAMLDPAHRRERLGLSAICLFATSLAAGALGALMAFSESPWYGRYAALGLAPFGLTPAQDQQLAGLLMWIPAGWCTSEPPWP